MLQSLVKHQGDQLGQAEPVHYLKGEEYDVDELHGKQWTHARVAEQVEQTSEQK